MLVCCRGTRLDRLWHLGEHAQDRLTVMCRDLTINACFPAQIVPQSVSGNAVGRFSIECASVSAYVAQQSGNHENCDICLMLHSYMLGGTAGEPSRWCNQPPRCCDSYIPDCRVTSCQGVIVHKLLCDVVGQQVANHIQLVYRNFCMMMLQQEVALQPFVQLC